MQAPVFYGSNDIDYAEVQDPRDIFDFRDSRYLNPLPETRYTVPNQVYGPVMCPFCFFYVPDFKSVILSGNDTLFLSHRV